MLQWRTLRITYSGQPLPFRHSCFSLVFERRRANFSHFPKNNIRPKNRCFISIASFWEIAIKIKIGKLDLLFELKELATYLSKNNFEVLPIAFEHILETLHLEDHHRILLTEFYLPKLNLKG